MSRRLLTAGFALAVLWGVPSGFGRISAKPPDLPLVDNNVLPSPPLIVEECDAIGPNSLPLADAPTATPAMTIPMLFQLRPSVRRTMASCLLFGVHPLLALAPTEGTIDLDAEDYAPAPEPPPSVCPYVRQQQCPSDRHAVLFADPNFSRDVRQNLKALRQSRELLEKARELGRAGRAIEAFDCLKEAADLSTGSRFDEEIQAAALEVLSDAGEAVQTTEQLLRFGIQPTLPPVDAGVPVALDQVLYETLKVALSAAGDGEEQEAPVDSPFPIPVEFRFELNGGFRMFAHFMPSGTVWHIEYGEKGLIWWASPDSGMSWKRLDGGLE